MEEGTYCGEFGLGTLNFERSIIWMLSVLHQTTIARQSHIKELLEGILEAKNVQF